MTYCVILIFFKAVFDPEMIYPIKYYFVSDAAFQCFTILNYVLKLKINVRLVRIDAHLPCLIQ